MNSTRHGADAPEPTETTVGLESAPDVSAPESLDAADATGDLNANTIQGAAEHVSLNASVDATPGADGAVESPTPQVPSRKVAEFPESLRLLHADLLTQEAATDAARIRRNIEVARLRDEAKISQYRISKWLGVTERAVMLMAKQGREHNTQTPSE